MTALRKIDNDFTVSEVIEYERRFNETLDELSDYENPNAEKVAYLGFMRCRRDDLTLTFDQYIESTSAKQAQIDAFGGQKEESIEDSLHVERSKRMARWCMATGFGPSEYRSLTFIEQNAFIEVLIERNKEQAKANKGRRSG